MTITSLGTAPNAGGSPRSTLLAPPKARKITTHKSRRLPGGCAGGAVDVRNQEKAANFERPGGPCQEPEVAAVALALPPPSRVQEPLKQKRGRDTNGRDIIWKSKKRRSVVAATRERGNAMAEVNRTAAAATSFLTVQEPVGNRDGVDCICKKGHRSSGGSVGVTVDERTEEKVWPFKFGAPVHGLDDLRQDLEVSVLDLALPLRSVPEPMKRDHHGKRTKHSDQVNTAEPSTPPQGIQRPAIKAKAAVLRGRKSTKHSDLKTTKEPFMSLSSGLQCLGVTNVTPVLAKTLTPTDSRLNQARLQFSRRVVMDSPLMSMLTPDERQAVHKEGKLEGLQLEALDRHGRSYNMRFGYIGSNKAYRLKQQWRKFLTQNGVSEGDLVEVGAFRVNGRVMLTLLNYAMEGPTPEEIEAAKGLLMLSDFKDETKSYRVRNNALQMLKEVNS